MGFYRHVVRPLLFSLDAEDAHSVVVRQLGSYPALLTRSRKAYRLTRDVGGVKFTGPVGLAAGADKGGHALLLWERLGFGAAEIGTVTLHPQVGNERPRIHRLVEHRAIVNRMGFPSEGADVVAARLVSLRERGRWPGIPVGVNIGKNKDVPDDQAHLDYARCAAKFRGLVDYVVVNVSSPNTPGLRGLQESSALERILDSVGDQASGCPVFVKLSPDMGEVDLAKSVAASERSGVSGIIVTNTTLSRPMRGLSAAYQELQGGMSGAPIFPLARHAIRIVLESTRLSVIGVGGVDSPERARELVDMGCAAVQLYSGLVYEGPSLVSRINRSFLLRS